MFVVPMCHNSSIDSSIRRCEPMIFIIIYLHLHHPPFIIITFIMLIFICI